MFPATLSLNIGPVRIQPIFIDSVGTVSFSLKNQNNRAAHLMPFPYDKVGTVVCKTLFIKNMGGIVRFMPLFFIEQVGTLSV